MITYEQKEELKSMAIDLEIERHEKMISKCYAKGSGLDRQFFEVGLEKLNKVAGEKMPRCISIIATRRTPPKEIETCFSGSLCCSVSKFLSDGEDCTDCLIYDAANKAVVIISKRWKGCGFCTKSFYGDDYDDCLDDLKRVRDWAKKEKERIKKYDALRAEQGGSNGRSQ